MSSTWRRNLWATIVAEFLAIMGFASFSPILAYYIEYLGVTGDRVTTWTGVVSSAPSFAMGFMAPIWGVLSDRYGRKVMVERAMFSAALLIMFMGFARSVEQLALLRFLQGGLTGTVTAVTTLVASSTPEERLGETLGKLQFAIYLGVTLGPVAGGFVGDQFGYRFVFWMTAAFLLISGSIVLLVVHEDFTPTEEALEGTVWQGLRSSFAFGALGSLLVLVLGLRFGMRVGVRFTNPVLPLLVRDLVADEALLGTMSGLTLTVSGLFSAAAAPVLGRWADRYGGRDILIACAVGGGGALVLQGVAPSYIVLLIGQALLGVALGGTLAVLSAFIGRLAPEGRSGLAYGLDTTAVSLANAVGPFLGGWLGGLFSLRVPFLVGAVLMLVSVLGVLRLPPDGEASQGGVKEPAHG